jgi:hypothetical protein
MATAKAAIESLKWSARPTKAYAGEGIGMASMLSEETRTYRVAHYLNYGDEPFFAQVRAGPSRGRWPWSLISRHSALAAAIRACEKHAQANPRRWAKSAKGSRRSKR